MWHLYVWEKWSGAFVLGRVSVIAQSQEEARETALNALSEGNMKRFSTDERLLVRDTPPKVFPLSPKVFLEGNIPFVQK